MTSVRKYPSNLTRCPECGGNMFTTSTECSRCRYVKERAAALAMRREKYALEIGHLQECLSHPDDIDSLIRPEVRPWYRLAHGIEFQTALDRRRKEREARLQYLNQLCGYAEPEA